MQFNEVNSLTVNRNHTTSNENTDGFGWTNANSPYFTESLFVQKKTFFEFKLDKDLFSNFIFYTFNGIHK